MRKKRLAVGVIVVVSLMGAASFTSAQSDNTTSLSVEEIAAVVQERYQRAKSLTADFHQVAFNKALGRARKAAGRLYIHKPGKMRWQYAEPDRRLVISDGRTVWLYFPSNKQVMIERADTQNNLMRVFLSGEGDLSNDFHIEQVSGAPPPKPGEYALQLRPKIPHINVTKLVFYVDRVSYLMRRITTYDMLGNDTTISLSNVTLDADIAEEKFTFQVPPGVEIVTPPAALPARR